MTRSFCFDTAHLGKAHITASGSLQAPVTISKVGVSDYGYARKAKLPDELLSDLTIDSIRGLPITDEHPEENENFVYVTPDNFKAHAKGNVSEPRVEGDSIKALITIWDKALIDKVIEGKHEVSFGYSKVDEAKVGEFDGKPYEVIQRQIEGNHLAITDNARINGAAIEIDSNGKAIKTGKIKGENNMSVQFLKVEDGKIVKGTTLTYNKIDGNDITVDSEIHVELTAGRDSLKAKEIEVDSLNTKVEKLEKDKPADETEKDATIKTLELDSEVKAETIKGLEKKLENQKIENDSNLDKMVTDRIEVKENAKALEIDTANKSTLVLKKEIINKVMEKDADKLSDIEIDAYYGASLKLKKETANIETKNTGGNDPQKNHGLELDTHEKILSKRNEDLKKLKENESK